MKKILVFGALGFAGRHLCDSFTPDEDSIVLMSDIHDNAGRKNYYPCDLSDKSAVESLIKNLLPHEIYNISGTFSNDFHVDYQNNVLATKNILDALCAMKNPLNTRVLVVGSAAEYGEAPCNKGGIAEDAHPQPVSSYGLTKVFQTHLAQYYCTARDMHVLIARPFNFLGCCLNDRLFVGRLLKQVIQHQNGALQNITLGNLSNFRDYIDIRDAVHAFKTIVQSGMPGNIYNVGTGQPMQMGTLTDRILAAFDIKKEALITKNFPSKFDVEYSFANVDKLESLGFHARCSLEDSLGSIKTAINKMDG